MISSSPDHGILSLQARTLSNEQFLNEKGGTKETKVMP